MLSYQDIWTICDGPGVHSRCEKGGGGGGGGGSVCFAGDHRQEQDTVFA